MNTLQTTFDLSHRKGDKVYVIRNQQNKPNVLEILHVTVVGWFYVDDPTQGQSTSYLVKQKPEDPQDQTAAVLSSKVYSTEKEAVDASSDQAADLRAEMDRQIEEMKGRIKELTKFKENILRVTSNEVSYQPQSSNIMGGMLIK